MAKHVLMRSRTDQQSTPEQVFSDRFSDHDYAWNLTDWLNRHSDTHTYWLEEV